VYCVKFSPNGEMLATAGFDRKVLLWDIYNNCKNIGILGEGKNAILEINWYT
jgi:Prp8 binding protein